MSKKPLRSETHPAYVQASYSAVCGCLKRDFDRWSKKEQTYVILASLEAVPGDISARDIAVDPDSFGKMFEAAMNAAEIVLFEREERRRKGR